METVVVNFDAIDTSYAALVNDYNKILDQADLLKKIVDSVDLGWVDTIVGSSEKYKDHSFSIIKDIVLNLEELGMLLQNIDSSMEIYSTNESTWEANVNSVSF
jgi:hypothetical protein